MKAWSDQKHSVKFLLLYPKLSKGLMNLKKNNSNQKHVFWQLKGNLYRPFGSLMFCSNLAIFWHVEKHCPIFFFWLIFALFSINNICKKLSFVATSFVCFADFIVQRNKKIFWPKKPLQYMSRFAYVISRKRQEYQPKRNCDNVFQNWRPHTKN